MKPTEQELELKKLDKLCNKLNRLSELDEERNRITGWLKDQFCPVAKELYPQQHGFIDWKNPRSMDGRVVYNFGGLNQISLDFKYVTNPDTIAQVKERREQYRRQRELADQEQEVRKAKAIIEKYPEHFQ